MLGGAVANGIPIAEPCRQSPNAVEARGAEDKRRQWILLPLNLHIESPIGLMSTAI
jgi:hypothetical protein